MRYIKYCSEEYHPKNINSEIQIGTLNYYRMSNNKFIKDPFEAKAGFFRFNPTKDIVFSSKEINLLSGGGILGSGLKIEKGGCLNLNFNYEVPNSYLFCCSLVDKPCLEQANNLGYNSYYEITNINEFMKIVWSEMINLNKPKIKETRNIRSQVIYMNGKVDYCQKNNVTFDEYIDILEYLLFTKSCFSPIDTSVRFEDNSEFRLAWLIKEVETSNIMEVRDEPIRIPVKKILPYLKWGNWE